MDNDSGFAGPGAGQDKDRAVNRFDSLSLLRV